MSLLPSPPTNAAPFRQWFSTVGLPSSSLGTVEHWPASLATLVDLALDTKTPVFIAWGDELRLIYNEAYAEILGDRHPHALGRSLPSTWPEIWEEIRPLVQRALAGESLYRNDVAFEIHRNGVPQTAWFSFSYTPIRNATGGIAGIYCALAETTQQIEIERGRTEALDRLRQLFDRAPGFMAVTTGPDHLIELLNDACKQLIGRADVTGRPVREAVPELAEQVYLDLFDQVYATGEPYLGKQMAVYFQPPGQPRALRYVDFVFQPISAADGRVRGVFVQGMDVTEHRLTEEQLRRSEVNALQLAVDMQSYARKLDALLDAAPVGILYADADGRLEMVNPAIRDAWGPIPDTRNIEDYRQFKAWWADDSARHGQPLAPGDWPLARALRGEEHARAIVEVEPFVAGGRRRTVKLQAKPMRAHDGTIVGAVVAEMDVTEQVQIQNRLRESEARFRTITDAMPQMVWSTLPDGRPDYFNRRWHEFTGLREDSTGFPPLSTVLHADDYLSTRDAWRHSLASGEPLQAEFRLRHRSGEYRWVLGRALPVRDPAGAVVRWMGTCTDIHEHRRAQELLQDAARRKDEFLAMLAHELRNPLAPIRSAADVLTSAADDPHRVRQIGDILRRQVRHMTRMVDDLLDVSRVTRGLARLDLDMVDLKAVLQSAIEQTCPLIEERRHELATLVPAGPVTVHGDRVRLIQVVANLLNNAAKYTRQRGLIEITLDAADGDAVVEVKDNGSGIDPALLPQVFDLFTQGERGPDRQQGGLGIGLALSRSIVALHDGTLAAHSAGRGRGSCFRMTLPLAAPAPMPDARTISGPRPVQRPSRADPLRVMVVDDNIDAARTIELVLSMQGHAVGIHHDASAALAASAVDPAEVYVLDIGLPDLSGHELARRLRADPRTARAYLIALTGYGRSEDRLQSMEAGFDRHFIKPVDATELIQALQEFAAARP